MPEATESTFEKWLKTLATLRMEWMIRLHEKYLAQPLHVTNLPYTPGYDNLYATLCIDWKTFRHGGLTRRRLWEDLLTCQSKKGFAHKRTRQEALAVGKVCAYWNPKFFPEGFLADFDKELQRLFRETDLRLYKQSGGVNRWPYTVGFDSLYEWACAEMVKVGMSLPSKWEFWRHFKDVGCRKSDGSDGLKLGGHKKDDGGFFG